MNSSIKHKVKEEIAKSAAESVWNKLKSANVRERDYVKIGRQLYCGYFYEL
jgi:hypothetical protein